MIITLFTIHFLALIRQMSVITILGICVVFFSVLLILVLRKSYKLKAENEKLMKATDNLLEDDNKEYTDFTEGHMYSNTAKKE
ncbi:hypothetical protein Q4512_08200 [Oceanihabitans sp. 2_MG-2023]|uniref:hypothetical protein n=1 Tax=Oceanihabitans sp. 2_MG-2023 TaxID=3062661 RepID=UPI0026E2D2D1|nr:hypothetical protein [Oceanihabitans sp. 2_MG-2023]MDO6596895.1 hypothetical protein [Oceanihabitans sp. 2_MG-2023]